MTEAQTETTTSPPVVQVQSVQRALRLLNFFAPGQAPKGTTRDEWSVTDLARASGLHKSIVARLMTTLATEGFVVQDPRLRTYRIGSQAFAVGATYRPFVTLDRVARPIMEELTARCGHASYLGVPAERDYIYVVAVESTKSVRVTLNEGARRAYHAGAVGKILLADHDEERVRVLVGSDPLPSLTDRTITSTDVLLEELAVVRQTGLAFNRGESMEGAASVAVALRDASGGTIAGVGIIYPSHIVSDDELNGLIEQVVDAGRRISQQLRSI